MLGQGVETESFGVERWSTVSLQHEMALLLVVEQVQQADADADFSRFTTFSSSSDP